MGEISSHGWLTTARKSIITTRTGRTLGGLSYDQYRGIPWRFLFHTTEGSTIAGAEGAYRANGSAPHFTLDPKTSVIHQHISLDYGGYALRNERGGVETNRMHCIQVELVGFASETHFWPERWMRFIGTELVGPVLRWKPTYGTKVNPNIVETFYGLDAGFTLARPDAPQRQSYQEWTLYNGFCGHQHAPENSHWDPGKLDVDAILSAAREDDSMSQEQYDAIMARLDTIEGKIESDVRQRNKWQSGAWKSFRQSTSASLKSITKKLEIEP